MSSPTTLARARTAAGLIAVAGVTAAPRLAAQEAPAAVAALQTGDSAWAAGDRAAAGRAYGVAVRADSARSSRAVYRLATVEADRNRLGEAVALHRLYTRLEPRDAAGFVALARTLAWAARWDDAVATYDGVLRREPDNREAALGRAQTLAWAARFPASIAAYEAWAAGHPADGEAELAVARTLAWAGRLDEAEARYRRIAAAGRSADAEKGVARVTAWRGDLAASERLWRELSARYPRDPEAWTGLAQVLRWTGRPAQAEDALRTALAAAPGYGDARSQLRWVGAELAASAEPTAVIATDSDNNRSAYYATTAGVRAPWAGRVLVTGSHRDAEFGRTRGRSTGARVAARWSGLAGRLALRGEAGASRLASDTGGAAAPVRTVAALSARASGQLPGGLALEGGVSRAAFDETALLIANGIRTTGVDAGASLALPFRLTASGGIGRVRVAGGRVANARQSASAALRMAVRRGFSVGVAARSFGYDTLARGDGYFAPSAFLLVEGNTHLEVGRELGWSATVDGGVGRQTIRFTPDAEPRGNLAQRVGLGLLYRPTPGTELGASYGFANVAAPGTVSAAEYRAQSLSLRARLRL